MKNKKVRFVVDAAMIAALYAALTAALWEISSAGVQFRLSEALCVLPAFTPAAIPGLFLGCAVANLIGGTWVDVVFGSLATLLAALISYGIGRAFGTGGTGKPRLGARFLVPLPPVICNALIIPFVLYYGYGLTEAFGFTGTLPVLGLHALTVGAGEFAVCYVVGIPFMIAVDRIRRKIRLFS
jgi:uncharacterized membrane protein